MHTPFHHYYSGRTSKVGNNFQYIIHLLNTGTQNKTYRRVGGHYQEDKNRFLIISWKADDEILSPLNNKIFLKQHFNK